MASAEAAGDLLSIEIVYSPAAGQLARYPMRLPMGTRVEDALRQSGVLNDHAELVIAEISLGVWGKLRALSDVLRDNDRVEIYRPLKVDPKEARRQRYSSHRAKAKP